jgi:putative transcriptional regulator
MIRFKIREQMAEHHFRTGTRLTFDELAKETGIHRTTLSKIANQIGYNTTTDNIDALCNFFNCQISDLVEHIPGGMHKGED